MSITEYLAQRQAASNPQVGDRIADSTVTRTTDLAVGDRITEIDTPTGPFYEVLKVTAKTYVVEAAPEGYGSSVPMRFSRKANAIVLVADASR